MRAYRAKAVALSMLAACAVARASDGAAVARPGEDNAALRRRVDALEARVGELAAEVSRLRRRLAVAGSRAAAPVRRHKLDIRVEQGDWGDASRGDIRAVLLSAAGELWRHFPDRRLPPIVVRRGTSGPISLYDRGPGGEIVVKLDVHNRQWCQFAYQFAHEFCHILTNFHPRESKRNHWFAESLCEAASVYAVSRMGETWRTRPPYPNWKGYAASLTDYADDLRARQRKLVKAAAKPLGAWYAHHEAAMRKDAYDRDRNRVPAATLLEVLEADPARWRAVGSMNLTPPTKADTFAEYLAAWRADTPPELRGVVDRIAKAFGVELPVAAAAGETAE